MVWLSTPVLPEIYIAICTSALWYKSQWLLIQKSVYFETEGNISRGFSHPWVMESRAHWKTCWSFSTWGVIGIIGLVSKPVFAAGGRTLSSLLLKHIPCTHQSLLLPQVLIMHSKRGFSDDVMCAAVLRCDMEIGCFVLECIVNKSPCLWLHFSMMNFFS